MSRSRLVEENRAELVEDGYAASALPPLEVAALKVADALVVDPRLADDADRAEMLAELGPAGVVDLAVAVSIFMSMSKVIVALGLEPAEMETTVIATPAARP